MEMKDIMNKGTEWLKEMAEKLKDPEFRDEQLHKAAELAGEAAAKAQETAGKVVDATTETAKRAKDYIDENRIAPGAKDAYIKELEEELAEKDKEIRVLKRKLALKNWRS